MQTQIQQQKQKTQDAIEENRQVWKKTFQLPQEHKPYIDKYFLRANQILKAESLNPWVIRQVFIRKGPGKTYGIDEALAILDKYTPLVENKGSVKALQEGNFYASKDTQMLITAPVQDIVELETMYLGVLTAETTKRNDNYDVADHLDDVKAQMQLVVEAAQDRLVSYFGARHWRWDLDAAITQAAFEAGAKSASTDIGAATAGLKGMGTIPHASENIYAWKYGYNKAVVESTKAFDKHMDKAIPRIALIDYANKEVDDSVETAKALQKQGGTLYGVRIDTCGENICQGAISTPNQNALDDLIRRNIKIPQQDEKYWFGNGVTVTGAYAVRKGLDNAGFQDVKIFLTSGFVNPKKVEAFIRAEKILGLQGRLCGAFGVGGIYPARMATMDIIAVGPDPIHMQSISKIGRNYKANNKLELRLGGR
jgi:nicotinate phosphoribosyltransferase